MTVRTRLLPSATPGLDDQSRLELRAVAATGLAGNLLGSSEKVVSRYTVLWPTGTPGWETRNAGEGRPSSATGTGQVGAFYVAVNKTVAVTGIAGTGAAGTITAADTVTDSGTASGVAGTAAAGTVTAIGKGNVTPTGVLATGVLGDVYVGEAFMLDPVQAIGTAGVIGYTASGSASLTGVQSRPFANNFDFTSRLLVRAIRVTAYMEIS